MKQKTTTDQTAAKRKFRLSGTMRAESPLAQVMGKSSGADAALLINKESLRLNNEVVRVPVFSGGTMRSMFREGVALAIAEKVRPLLEGGRFDFQTLLTLLCGGTLVGTDKVPGKGDYTHMERLRSGNKVLSLFGGGLGISLLPGRVVVDRHWSICVETIAARQLRGTYNDGSVPKAADLVSKTFFTRLNRIESGPRMITTLSDSGFEDYINYEYTAQQTAQNRKEVKAQKKAVADARKKGEEAPAAATTTTEAPDNKAGHIQGIVNHEYVIAGTEFESNITVTDASLDDVGALLYSLAYFAKAPFFGGYRSRGYGRASLNYSIEEFVGDPMRGGWQQIGTCAVDGKNEAFTFSAEKDDLNNAVELFSAYLESLKPEDIVIPKEWYSGKAKKGEGEGAE